MTTKRGYKTNDEQPLELAWVPLINYAIFLRATIAAAIIGSVLTLVNQSGWVAGNEPLQLLQLILVFLTPFAVVTVAQLVGLRQARIDIIRHGKPAQREGLVATAVSHGIPIRAVAIGLVFGTLSAIIVLVDAILHTGDIDAVSIAPLAQAYVLPLLFGLLSQTISYRRSRYQFVNG